MTAPSVAGLAWPKGDLGPLRAAARRCGAVASSLRDTGGRLVGAAQAPDNWKGQASSAYGTAVKAYQHTFSASAATMSDAAGALEELARLVDRAQDQVKRLAREVEDAEARAAGAQAKAALAQAVSSAAQAALVAAPVVDAIVPGPDVVTSGLRSAASDASEALCRANTLATELQREAERVRKAAEKRARDLCDEVEAMDAATASKLRAATRRAPVGGKTQPAGGTPASGLGRVLAPTYAPHFVFDRDEEHMPGDYRDSLASANESVDKDGRRTYDLSDSERLRAGNLDTASLPYVFGLTADGRLQIQYWRWHHYNDHPGYTVDLPGLAPFGSGDAGIGAHPGDWERTSIQFGLDGKPTHVGYDAHGSDTEPATHQREWDDAERRGWRTRHPVVYVAHGGHGNYPEAGAFQNPNSALPDDQADGLHGRVWETRSRLVDGTTDPRLYEHARFGEDDGVTPSPQSPKDPERGPMDLEDMDPTPAPSGPAD